MFINSKKRFVLYLSNGTQFIIEKDYIGNIPDQVGSHWLIQAAIKDGSIATPDNTALSSLEDADTEAERRADASDVRENAEGEVQVVPDAKENKKTGK